MGSAVLYSKGYKFIAACQNVNETRCYLDSKSKWDVVFTWNDSLTDSGTMLLILTCTELL